METIKIAKLCHEVNKAYCESIGDDSQPSWKDAPKWQRESAENGVKFHLANPDSTPEKSHENWYKEKEVNGWEYGEKKDIEKKLHPCMVPYSELPKEQQFKDKLFVTIVETCKGL